MNDKQIRLPASIVARRLGQNRKWIEHCPSESAWYFIRNNRIITIYWNGRGVWISRKTRR